MFNAITTRIPCLVSFAIAFIFMGAGHVFAATIEEQTLAHLDEIRAIKPEGDKKTIEAYNSKMDAAWTFFNANKQAVLPILRRELNKELNKASPNQMLLLDTGYFIRLQDNTADKELGRQALLNLDPSAKIVRWNQQQLFMFAYAVVSDQDPRILPFLDRAFLQNGVTAFVTQHVMRLDETLVCAFLYGKHGPASEAHLREQLADRAVAKRVMEILIWLGSPASVPSVEQVMNSDRDYETFIRATAFMMSVGGPKGRQVMLSVKPKELDDKSREYLAKIRQDIEAISYDTLRKRFAESKGGKQPDTEVMKQRLKAMYENYGRDDQTTPESILDSELPNEYLTQELLQVRSRMFYRLSDEALDDVKITNAILNTLYYRGR